MRTETRHQLKQDRFSQATIDVAERTAHWTSEHQSRVIVGAIILVVGVSLGLVGRYFLGERADKASVALTAAVRTMETPVRPPNMPADPESPSFASAQERAAAARKQFQEIIGHYPLTKASDFSHYFIGLSAAQVGDNAAAEQELQKVASYHNSELSSLAKLGLASVYRSTNRSKQAIDTYKQLIAKPTTTVSKTTAQMELAATYQAANQPLEAKRTYQEIAKENASTEIAQMAQQKLQEIK